MTSFFKKIIDKIYYFTIFKIKSNIFIEGKIFIIGKPLLDINKKATLKLGNGVLLNSRNKGYHLSMYSSVKIMISSEQGLIEIGENSRIHGSCLHAKDFILIGKNCLIAANCNIVDSNGHKLSMDNPELRCQTVDSGRGITIKDNVWIGTNCTILPGVTIGTGSIIPAGTVVRENVDENTIYRVQFND